MLKRVALFVVSAACVPFVYYGALILFSFQTLVVENTSDVPVTVAVYDMNWTVETGARAVKRFQSNKGDAHFTLYNADTRTEFGAASYLTGSMSNCHVIRIHSETEFDTEVSARATCHLRHW